MGDGLIVRRGGSGGGGLPAFSYTGSYQLLDDGNKNWRIKFLTSGTLTVSKLANSIDLFLVGGGGGAANGGGGGGYTATIRGLVVNTGTSYSIVVGAGGTAGTVRTNAGTGGTSSAFTQSIGGGLGGCGWDNEWGVGGAGGSGGGGYGGQADPGIGGTDGSDGTKGVSDGGTGQGTTTREFGESNGTLYASGGNGGNIHIDPVAGAVNTGDGGSGNFIAGGSGIVVIRNKR